MGSGKMPLAEKGLLYSYRVELPKIKVLQPTTVYGPMEPRTQNKPVSLILQTLSHLGALCTDRKYSQYLNAAVGESVT